MLPYTMYTDRECIRWTEEDF